MNDDQAMSVITVFTCIAILADAVATLPLNAYKRTKDRTKRPVDPAPSLVSNPWPEGTLQDWLTAVMVSLTLRGNFFGQIVDRDTYGTPTTIMPIHPDTVFARRDLRTGERVYRVSGVPVPTTDMLHIPALLIPGSFIGLNPVEYMRRPFALAAAAEQYGSQFFSNSANPSGIIEVEEDLTPEQARELKRDWQQMHGGINNAQYPAVLTAGAKWSQIAINPDDAQFLQSSPGDTAITRSDGSIVRADQLVVGDEIFGWDWEHAELVSSSVNFVACNEPKPMIEIVTHRGRRLRTTAEHPYLTSLHERRRGRSLRSPDAWVLAESLRVGDYVRVGLGFAPKDVDEPVSAEEGWFIGALTGDGGLTQKTITFDKPVPEVAARVAAFAETLGGELRPESRGECRYRFAGFGYGDKNELKALLSEHGMLGVYSSDRTVSDRILAGGRDGWIGFLSGYLDTDGTVTATHLPQPRVAWDSSSLPLLERCQHMLAGLGVQSSLYQVRMAGGTDYRQDEHVRHQLTVCGRGEIEKLAGLLDLAHPEKAFRLAWWAHAAGTRANTPALTEYDRIVAVNRLEPEATISIGVEGTHSHVTNGLITHNTRDFQRHEIASFFRIPEHMLGFQDRTSSWGCLPGETSVLTTSGAKPIADVNVGDELWSLGEFGIERAKVHAWRMTGYKPLLTFTTENRSIRATSNHHMIVVRDGIRTLIDAKDVVVGDLFMVVDPDSLAMSLEEVEQIRCSEIAEPVYDIEVAVSHTFIANSIIIANSGIEQMEIGFVINTLRGWLSRIENPLSNLLPRSQVCKFDLRGRLRGDTLQRYQAYTLALNNRFMNIDEVRELEDLPALPNGMGQSFWSPLNFAPIDQILSGQVAPSGSGGVGGGISQSPFAPPAPPMPGKGKIGNGKVKVDVTPDPSP